MALYMNEGYELNIENAHRVIIYLKGWDVVDLRNFPEFSEFQTRSVWKY